MRRKKESHGARFEELVKTRKASQTEIGKICDGRSPQAVRQWKTRGVPAKYAIRVARLLECEPSEISAINDAPAAIMEIAESLVPLEVYNEEGASIGRTVVDLPDQGITDAAAIDVTCSAMVPTIIPGDRVFVDLNRHATPGTIVAARAPGGNLLIRKYREVDTDGTFQLAPDSPDWPTITSDDDGGYDVMGVVVGLLRATI